MVLLGPNRASDPLLSANCTSITSRYGQRTVIRECHLDLKQKVGHTVAFFLFQDQIVRFPMERGPVLIPRIRAALLDLLVMFPVHRLDRGPYQPHPVYDEIDLGQVFGRKRRHHETPVVHQELGCDHIGRIGILQFVQVQSRIGHGQWKLTHVPGAFRQIQGFVQSYLKGTAGIVGKFVRRVPQ